MKERTKRYRLYIQNISNRNKLNTEKYNKPPKNSTEQIMDKCNFCTKSKPNGKCTLMSKSMRDSFCSRAIDIMTSVYNHRFKISEMINKYNGG